MNQIESLQRILQDYATPVVTLRRPINRDAVELTIAWHDAVFTRDIKDLVAPIFKKQEASLEQIKGIVALAIRGLADCIKGGTCSYCGSRKEGAKCQGCGA